MTIPKVTEREMEILELIWEGEARTAQMVAAHFLQPENGGYSKNTTYTFLNRLVKKGVLIRQEPGFICIPCYSREQVQADCAQSLLDRLYNGSLGQLFAQFVDQRRIDEKELRTLQIMIEQSLEEEKS